jgi:hypothetical protein
MRHSAAATRLRPRWRGDAEELGGARERTLRYLPSEFMEDRSGRHPAECPILLGIVLVEIGQVSGEGGPLLLVDWKTAPAWRGIEDGGTDYERACAAVNEEPLVEGRVIAVGWGSGLVWEMEGGGTADVFRRGSDYVVVSRAWLGAPDDREAPRRLAEAITADRTQIGELAIRSGVLAVLWAPEDGRAFESLDPHGLPAGRHVHGRNRSHPRGRAWRL